MEKKVTHMDAVQKLSLWFSWSCKNGWLDDVDQPTFWMGLKRAMETFSLI